MCSGLKVIYCSLRCQKLHWFTHEKRCCSVHVQGAHLQPDAPRLQEVKGSNLLLGGRRRPDVCRRPAHDRARCLLDESELERETAAFLQALCLRAEDKMAAAGCPAELLDCPSSSGRRPHDS